MKKIYYYLLACLGLFLSSTASVFAQSDCSSGFCISGNVGQTDPNGLGTLNDGAASCGTSEHNAQWFYFQAQTAGKIRFIIQTYNNLGTPTNLDYDWALYSLSGPPSSGSCPTKTEIACNFSGTPTLPGPFNLTGQTGIWSAATLASFTSDATANAVAGGWYALLVDEFAGGANRFSINFLTNSTGSGGENANSTFTFMPTYYLGVSAIASTAGGAAVPHGSATQPIYVTIRNNGGVSIPIGTPYTVSMSVDGAAVTNQTFTLAAALAANTSVTIGPLTATANLSGLYCHNIAASTSIGCYTSSNNLYNICPVPTILVNSSNPYCETWNGGAGSWTTPVAGTGGATFALATAGGGITSATQAMHTNGASAPSDPGYGALVSPQFDLSQTCNPRIAFDYGMNTSEAYDGFKVQYSTNGSTWTDVPTGTGACNFSNWNPSTISSSGTTISATFGGTQTGWAAGTAAVAGGTLKTVFTQIPAAAISATTQFRIVFANTFGSPLTDMYVDNFRAWDAVDFAFDATTPLVIPSTTGACGTFDVKVRIRNNNPCAVDLSKYNIQFAGNVDRPSGIDPIVNTLVTTGIVPGSGTLDVTVLTGLDMTVSGTYTFTGTPGVSGICFGVMPSASFFSCAGVSLPTVALPNSAIESNSTCTATANNCMPATTRTITIPTITMTDILKEVCVGTAPINYLYSATTGTPNQYSLTQASGTPTICGLPSNAALAAGSVSIPTTSTIGNAPAGTYTFNLTVTNSTTGCTSAPVLLTTTLVSPPLPTLVSSNCDRTASITLQNSPAAGYAWVYNVDAAVAAGSPQIATTSATSPIQAVGNHTFNFGVVNTVGPTLIAGCTASQTVDIFGTPTVAFTANTNPQCLTGNSFDFTNTNTVNAAAPVVTTYDWNYGDGSTNGTTADIVGKSFAAAGTYEVVSTVTNTLNGKICSANTSLNITVIKEPVITNVVVNCATNTATVYCSGGDGTFTLSAGAGNAQAGAVFPAAGVSPLIITGLSGNGSLVITAASGTVPCNSPDFIKPVSCCPITSITPANYMTDVCHAESTAAELALAQAGITVTGGALGVDYNIDWFTNPDYTGAVPATFANTGTCNMVCTTLYARVTCVSTGAISSGGVAKFMVHPAPAAPTISLSSAGATCTYNLNLACANIDVASPASIAAVAQGTLAAMVNVDISNAGCMASTFSVSRPLCPATCPITVTTAANYSTDVCTGATTSSVMTAAQATLVVAGGALGVDYTVAWFTNPDYTGVVPATFTHSGIACAVDCQKLYARVTCTATGSVLYGGMASVMIYPAPTAPTLSKVDNTCAYTLTLACPNLDMTAFAPTAQIPGTVGATANITVTNAGGCSANFPAVVYPTCVGCDVTIVSVTPSACAPATNTHSVTVVVAYNNAVGGQPISATIGGTTVTGSTPAQGASGVEVITITAQNSDGLSHAVNAQMGATCTAAASSYTAPASCGACSPANAGSIQN